MSKLLNYLNPFASAAEINTGTEAAKAIAPDQLAASAPTIKGLTIEGAIGPELADEDNFTLGTGWAQNGGGNSYTHTTLNTEPMTQDVGAEVGKGYLVSFTVGSMTTGLLWVTVGGVEAAYVEANGDFSKLVTAVDASALTFDPTAGGDDATGAFDGTVTVVSVRESPALINAIVNESLGTGQFYVDAQGRIRAGEVDELVEQANLINLYSATVGANIRISTGADDASAGIAFTTPNRVYWANNHGINEGAQPRSLAFGFYDYDTELSNENAIVIGADGYFGVNTPVQTAQLHVDGTVRFESFGAGAATFDADGNISSVSDSRLKNVQGDFKAGLPEIMGLNPVLFKYKPESKLDTENTYAGLVAQEVMQFIPEAVGKNQDGLYSIQDRPIIAALINAVKDLQIEIDKLGGKKVNVPTPKVREDKVIKTSKVRKVYETVEVSKIGAFEMKEVNEQVKVNGKLVVDSYKTKYVLKDNRVVAQKIPVYQTAKKMKKVLRTGVKLNSTTGKFYEKTEKK